MNECHSSYYQYILKVQKISYNLRMYVLFFPLGAGLLWFNNFIKLKFNHWFKWHLNQIIFAKQSLIQINLYINFGILWKKLTKHISIRIGAKDQIKFTVLVNMKIHMYFYICIIFSFLYLVVFETSQNNIFIISKLISKCTVTEKFIY